MSKAHPSEKKSHVCPPSNAIHPSDRWESLFVYSFVCKFTSLRGKIEGLETPMEWALLHLLWSILKKTHHLGTFSLSFETALLSREPNPILTQLLGQFILNLKPHTRNLRWTHSQRHSEFNYFNDVAVLAVQIKSRPLWRASCLNISNPRREQYFGTRI